VTHYALRNDQVAFRAVGDESLVVQLAREEVHLANPTATMLLELLARGASQEELVARLVDETDVDPEQAEQDVEAFLGDAMAKELVVQ
jgi:hypothetical protein